MRAVPPIQPAPGHRIHDVRTHLNGRRGWVQHLVAAEVSGRWVRLPMQSIVMVPVNRPVQEVVGAAARFDADDLTGSTALVIGGSSGIGRAAAAAPAGLGAHVVLSARDTTRRHHVVAAIPAPGGRADLVAAPLTPDARAP